MIKTTFKKDKFNYKMFINKISFILSGIVYPSFFMFSLIIAFPGNINNSLFKNSILFEFFNFGLLLLGVTSIKHYTRRDLITYILLMLFLGLLIGILIIPDTIQVTINSIEIVPFLIVDLTIINYTFSLTSKIILIIFCSFFIFSFIYYGSLIHLHSRDKHLSKSIFMITILLSIPFLLYILYILSGFTIFREVHFYSGQFILLLLLIRFLKTRKISITHLTNKIYSINIYHKSGVQLYSYMFEFETPKTESSIWGNILIGLNHIVAEFIDTNNQINVLKTKNSDIIVEYNNEYGYAVLITTKQTNAHLSKMMHEFNKDFESMFKNELNEIQDLNNLIDISEFEGVEELIKKHFSLYF